MKLANDDKFHDLLTSKAEEHRNKLNREIDDLLASQSINFKRKQSLLHWELQIVIGVYLILIPCKIIGLIPISWWVLGACGLIGILLPVLKNYKEYKRGKKNV